ncbi:type IV secretion system protein [Rickettsia endosymbiont of Urophora cardui]|uniref:type IV secretion system protein n=1 Tax=Rickettsia endosymbiont of Urophora cardui TaxID=3066265 RepID=UPI00313C374A
MVFLIQVGAPILILYYGYSIMSGRGSNATVSEMMWNMARIGMIFAFMQNTGNLLDLSIGFIQELKSGFVGAESIFALLDQQVESTKKLAESLLQ